MLSFAEEIKRKDLPQDIFADRPMSNLRTGFGLTQMPPPPGQDPATDFLFVHFMHQLLDSGDSAQNMADKGRPGFGSLAMKAPVTEKLPNNDTNAEQRFKEQGIKSWYDALREVVTRGLGKPEWEELLKRPFDTLFDPKNRKNTVARPTWSDFWAALALG